MHMLNLLKKLFALLFMLLTALFELLDRLTPILMRIGGALGGLVVGGLYLIYDWAYGWPIDVAAYLVLLSCLIAGLLLSNYFIGFLIAPLIFPNSGYEINNEADRIALEKRRQARPEGCLVTAATTAYTFSVGMTLMAVLASFLSEDRPMIIFHMALLVQLAYAIALAGIIANFGSLIREV